MSIFAALLLIAAAGQQPCSGGGPPKNEPNCIPAQQYVEQQAQKPAACPKYQHWVEPSMWCGDLPATCFKPHCEDDMHIVTEKEWQEIQARIAAMDTYIKESACRNISYSATISTDGGKTLTNCNDLAPKREKPQP